MLAVCTIRPPGPPKSEISLPKDIRLFVLAGTFGFDIDGNL